MTLSILQISTPEVEAKLKNETRLLKADFGDGYTQTSGDGLNYIRKVWSLTFPYLARDAAQALYDFFDVTCGGGTQAFLYTVPSSPKQLKWTCEEYDWTEKEAGYVNITATLKQSFNLDV